MAVELNIFVSKQIDKSSHKSCISEEYVEYIHVMTTHPSLSAQTALFTPADRIDRLAKALAGPADIVIADLEDAVAADAKATARAGLRDFLTDSVVVDEHRGRLVVRVNGIGTREGRSDLAMLAALEQGLRPAVMVPKAEEAADLDRVAEVLPGVPVVVLVETVAGVLRLDGIARHPAVVRLAVGAVDLSAELGCAADSVPVHQARAGAVMASAAHGLASPLDSPCVDFTDIAVLAGAARTAVRDGFGGMLCIHPRQLEHIRAAFAPSPEEVAWAERVVAAGESAATVDGQMVDRPVVLRALRVLVAARRAAPASPEGGA